MNLSPDGTLLAAIHFSGKLTIWGIPSLKLQGEWDQSDQPGYDEINPDWRLSTEKRKKIKDKESYYPLMDINWWAENAVILARCSGALTVSSVKTLKNLLGKSCEWFESSPQVTSTHDGGFLSLECEIKLAPKRLRLESRPGEEDEGEDDSDSDDVTSAKARYFSYLKQGLYFVTEMERFAPPRKRSRTITKNYRLVSLRSTTPEELYQRKIDNEEYGEALSLAQAYGLDSDLVYQRQWRKSTVNIASIQDYLSKIKKRSWVLHECLERVPENVDAAKELLQYGLKGTDLEALIAIGKGEDGGRFILPGEVDVDEVPYEELLSPDEEAENRKEREARKHQELLLSVNFSKLTLEQKELSRSRLKLLSYLDRLATYEEILGGPHAAEQRYDAEFFKKFRNQNIVLSARTYARESNVRALEILFTYHGSDLLPHRLAILSNFPETTSPHEYSFLLPEACMMDVGQTLLTGCCYPEHLTAAGSFQTSEAMRDGGNSRDATQCRVKLKELRQAYQKTKESNGRSGTEPQMCRFYAELHAILGGAATTTPPLSVDSNDGVLSAMPEDFADGEDEEEEDEFEESTQHTVLPDSQDLFITLTEIPSQPNQAGEGTSELEFLSLFHDEISLSYKSRCHKLTPEHSAIDSCTPPLRESDRVDGERQQSTHRSEDTAVSRSKMIFEPVLQDEDEFLYEAQPELLKYRTTKLLIDLVSDWYWNRAYGALPELLKYRTTKLSIDLVSDWYWNRAQEIENYAMQVDCALSLVRLGMERNIPGLQVLCDNLVTLEMLIYETGCNLTLTLKDLLEMKDSEKLRLLMVNSSDERYVKNVYQWMVPFLHRCENQSPGLANTLFREYLVSLAKEDLKFPLKIFQNSKPDCQQKIIPDQDQLMSMALECIYSCERDDQLSFCYDILECLPQRGYGPETDLTKTLHDKVDELEQILSVSEILEKHGLQKPVSFVKDTQNIPEQAEKLMIRLTRHTGRKQPPVNEMHWKGLLQDMLDMQQNVYTCLEPDSCYEIFTESLLCSSHLENIHLAGQMMHCSVWSVDPPVSVASKGKPRYRVSYEKSIKLVLAAGREYFNSSTSLTDSCMDLARCCLQLIVDCPSAIQEELDLIRALSYLEEFGLRILPLQVRLCSDRLSLIKDCIAQLPTNYKQSAKLLGLADLLRVAGDDQTERKGQVLILLVEQALHFQDYKAASMHCQELIATGYSKSWEVCSQLGQSEGYQDLGTRQELMAFALTHCPPGAIESLLAANSSLQTQILYQAVNYQLRPSEGGENINISVPSSLITKETPQGQEFGDVLKSSSGANAAVEKQSCHPFYESLIVAPCVAEWGNCPTTVLLQLASDALPNDMTLSLAYLLALPQVVDANKCFEKQSHSALSLQLASYYYSLQIYAHLAPCFKDKCHPLYRFVVMKKSCQSSTLSEKSVHRSPARGQPELPPDTVEEEDYELDLAVLLADPKELIKMVTKHVSQCSYADWPEEIATLIKQLYYYNERLLDFTQAQILQGLGKGVDVQRFTADDQYKRETILGLADLSTGEIEDRAQSLGLFETLKTNPEALHEHMAKYVYPGIEGIDHQRLLYYFTLLENCGCSEFVKHAIKPETHIRLLKKFKAIAPDLNYKKLTDENVSPLGVLEPILTSQNILSISKLAPKIPEKDGSMLSPSSVYTIWLQKLFWNGDRKLIKKTPETTPEWLSAYDVCAKYFDRLYPGDIVTFLDDVTFSSKAVTKLSVDARLEMTNKAIKAMQQIIEKSRKKNSEDGMDGTGSTPVAYEKALNHLQQSLAHLETLNHRFITSLKNSDQEMLQKYGHLYDLSRSEKEKIHDQAVAMCIDGQPLDMIQQLLEVAVGDLELSPRDIVQCAINKIVFALSDKGAECTLIKDPLQILEGIVSAVHASAEKGEKLVSSDDLLEWLRPFCGDDSLPVKPRIKVLQIMEQAFHLSDEDSRLLVFFRTHAVLKACWPETKEAEGNLSTEQHNGTTCCTNIEAIEEPPEGDTIPPTHVSSLSPDGTIMSSPPTSGDDFKSFQELFKRVADSLNISLAELLETQHKLTDILHTSPTAKIALPINVAMMDPAKTIWQMSTTAPPSCKRSEKKYYIPAKGAELLFTPLPQFIGDEAS
ncbi:Neuroblastoma-amplified sequence [Chelonia mydas]|uniref:Neuroblastoma-amplified sequence n=1 Tax=Chelonia mydas TaxID=8469 RepID=M7BWZ9_CHEMY|nr:Neuroblastoma-amplified sequence [Chelonia mydas]